MKIVLSGVETKNKGAELMLYAILQEIERKYPDATVYTPYSDIRQGFSYITTSLNLKYTPLSRLIYNIHLAAVFRQLHLPLKWLYKANIVKHADFFIDASGFHFSDQKKNFTPLKVARWNCLLRDYHRQGTKIVFMPQAFGPAIKKNTLNGLKCISKYADLIMARERVSYGYLEKSGVMDMNKVRLQTDFTSLVEGVAPEGYKHLKDGICIIPNLRMVDTGTISKEKYIGLISAIANSCKASGHPIYLLNHEGKEDEQLAYECRKRTGNNIEVVTGLNALEVKGMIASAYIVITSRFHGLASALNSCVPCLATSWSHKYQELFKDYGLSDCVLPLDNNEKAIEKVFSFMDNNMNAEIRQHLTAQVEMIKTKTTNMWNTVWNGL
ncbi:MAG: polysaccharide pyruvyl transferase family protein [Prevotella sp.]|nr:polysaccharide pyruvyl transferase family protein [Prevotella sp.]